MKWHIFKKKSIGTSSPVYLAYRYIKAYSIYFMYCVFGLMPIKTEKIVFITREGEMGYGCNPKAIADELIRRQKEKKDSYKYELVWLVNNEKKSFPKEIKVVKNNFINRAYQLSTAHIWIDSHRKPFGTRKRRGQLYIQTWHGPIGFKAVGGLREKSSFPKIAEVVSKADSSIIDYFISNSQWCSEVYRKGLYFKGEILVFGSPRCDVLTKNDNVKVSQIKQKYGIPVDAKVIMYAPTFRGGDDEHEWVFKVADASLEFNQILTVLNKNWGGDWYVMLRMHPHLVDKYKEFPTTFRNDRIIDVSQHEDMYELLTITNLLLSDYSSVAFDASYAKIPVFLYTSDVEEYKNRRGLLWEINELPFPEAKTTSELVEKIKQFNYEKYCNELEVLFQNVGLVEDGQASERIVNAIEKFILEGKG